MFLVFIQFLSHKDFVKNSGCFFQRRKGYKNHRQISGMIHTCPGVSNLKSPTLEIKICPRCGEEVEIFSDDMKATCQGCNLEIFNDIVSCVQWCKYARECVGDEMFNTYAPEKN
jgi:NADH pyrophosphatase NudC (nudix superfamily)